MEELWEAIERAYELVASDKVARVDVTSKIKVYRVGAVVRIDIKGAK